MSVKIQVTGRNNHAVKNAKVFVAFAKSLVGKAFSFYRSRLAR